MLPDPQPQEAWPPQPRRQMGRRHPRLERTGILLKPLPRPEGGGGSPHPNSVWDSKGPSAQTPRVSLSGFNKRHEPAPL